MAAAASLRMQSCAARATQHQGEAAGQAQDGSSSAASTLRAARRDRVHRARDAMAGRLAAALRRVQELEDYVEAHIAADRAAASQPVQVDPQPPGQEGMQHKPLDVKEEVVQRLALAAPVVSARISNTQPPKLACVRRNAAMHCFHARASQIVGMSLSQLNRLQRASRPTEKIVAVVNHEILKAEEAEEEAQVAVEAATDAEEAARRARRGVGHGLGWRWRRASSMGAWLSQGCWAGDGETSIFDGGLVWKVGRWCRSSSLLGWRWRRSSSMGAWLGQSGDGADHLLARKEEARSTMKEKKKEKKKRSVKKRRQKAFGPFGQLLAYVAMVLLLAGVGNLGYDWEIATTPAVHHVFLDEVWHLMGPRFQFWAIYHTDPQPGFAEADIDGDLVISLEEYRATRAGAGDVIANEFQDLDIDEDGHLDLKEYCEVLANDLEYEEEPDLEESECDADVFENLPEGEGMKEASEDVGLLGLGIPGSS